MPNLVEQTLQDTHASSKHVATSTGTLASSKKKPPKNGTPKSSSSKSTTPMKQKTTSSKTGKEIRAGGGTDYDVELQADQQPKTQPKQIKVKQRSSGTLTDTGSSTVIAQDTVPNSAAVVDPGGYASGHYGVLLETKRTEQLCLSFALQKRHVEALHRAFKCEEQLGTGEITTGEFFTMLREQPRQLTKGLFEKVGLAREPKRLRFDDFVVCVVTVATWSRSELLNYAFKQFDVGESGVMDGRELRAFCEGLKSDSSFYFAKNVNTAREKLTLRDRKQPNQSSSGQLQIEEDIEANTLVDLEDLVKGSTNFQVAFYPLMQLQQNVRACALGESFWTRVTQRRQDVEVVVQYMGLHKGKPPPMPFVTRILAHLMPFSRAHANVLVRKLAVLKFAEEQRQRQEKAQTRAKGKALGLTQIEEDK